MAVKLCTGLWYHNIELMHEQVGNDKEGKGRGAMRGNKEGKGRGATRENLKRFAHAG